MNFINNTMKTKQLLLILLLFAISTGIEIHGSGRIEFAKFPAKILPGVSERDYGIYLPDSYDRDTDKVYPVLYLLHGGFGSYKDWPVAGQLKAVADSLIKAGIIEEMVIICPDGRCRNNTMWFDMDDWPAEKHFFTEMIPYMEKHYHIKSDRSGRAIAGLSLGGGAAIAFALERPEIFAASCGLSAYIRSIPEIVNPGIAWIQPIVDGHNPIEMLKNTTPPQIDKWKNIRWLIDCGDRDFTISSNIEFEESLNRLRICHKFLMRSGTHNWAYWTSSLPTVLKFVNASFKNE